MPTIPKPHRVSRLVVHGATLACLASCGSESVSPPGAPTTLTLISGGRQNGVVGTELAAPIVVLASDDHQHPIANARVRFDIVSGDGQAITTSTTTHNAGLARLRWRLGTSTTLAQTASAYLDGLASSTLTVGATALSDVPVALRIDTSAPTAQIAEPLSVAFLVIVADQYGNRAAKGGAVVTAVIGASAGSTAKRELTGSNMIVSDADGRALFRDLAIVGDTGDATIVFASDGLTATTGRLRLSAGKPVRIDAVGASTPVAQVGGIGPPLSARVGDVSNNPVSGIAVSFAIVGGASLGQAVSGVDGIATLKTWTAPLTSGEVGIIATAEGVAAAAPIFHVNVASGIGTHLRITSSPLTGEINTSQPVIALVTDANNNPVPDAELSWSVLSGAGLFPTATSKTDRFGQAASWLNFGRNSGPIHLRVSLGALSVDTTTLLKPGPYQKWYYEPPPTFIRLGSAFSFRIRAVDADYNGIPGIKVTPMPNNIEFVIGQPPLLVSSSPVTDSLGVATLTGVVAPQTGWLDYHLNVGGIEGFIQVVATADKGYARQVVETSFPTTAKLGTVVGETFRVLVYGADGRGAARAPVIFAVASGNGSLSSEPSGATTYDTIQVNADDAGFAQVVWFPPQAVGTYTMTARGVAPNDGAGTLTFTFVYTP